MDKVFLGYSLIDFTAGVESQPVTRIDLIDTEGNLLFTAGDDSGRILTATHNGATQEMADSILAKLSGFVYRPYDGSGAILDPAAELGDGLTVADTYVQLVSQDIKFGALFSSEIRAPELDEIEDEFPYSSPSERNLSRQIKKSERETIALITKTDAEIRLLVEDEVSGLSSSFTVELDSIKGDVYGLQEAFSSMELDIDGLTVRVGDAEGNIAALEYTIDGLTVTDESGTTLINGSRIETKGLFVEAANISGQLIVLDASGNNLLTAGDSEVKIAAWNVDNNSFYSGNSFSASDVFLCTGSIDTISIGGSEALADWVFKAGTAFGVQKDGSAYMSNASVAGKITATSGRIGPWYVENVTLYDGETLAYSGMALTSMQGSSGSIEVVYLTPEYLYATDTDIAGNRILMQATWTQVIKAAAAYSS